MASWLSIVGFVQAHLNGLTATGAVIAAGASCAYTWLTYRMLVLQRSPILLVTGVVTGGSAIVSELWNGSGVAAVNAFVFHHPGDIRSEQEPRIAWAGAVGPNDTRQVSTLFALRSTDSHAHFIYYQDAARRWYVTRVAMTGIGVSAIFLGQLWWFRVPKKIRQQARGETAVQYFRRLAFWQGLRHPIRARQERKAAEKLRADRSGQA